MAFKYNRFFSLLNKRGISTYKIRKENLVSQASLTKMRNGEGNIDTRTLERLCALLKCQPCDIMEYVDGEDDESRENILNTCINLSTLLSDNEKQLLESKLSDGQTIKEFVRSAILDKLR